MRTLVISDLHLGDRLRHDVLRLPEPLERLLATLDEVDRLVLLGDTVELMSRHPRRSMAAAEPVLRAIGRRMGAGREIILVPGNHDRPLISAWVRRQGSCLAPDSAVDPDATPALRRVLSWLAPADTRVSYPGVWLGDRIWATHGHYLDKHLIPESAFGFLVAESPYGHPSPEALRALGHRARGGAAQPTAWPGRYESGGRRRRRSREPLPARFRARPLGTSLETAAEALRAATLPHVPRLLMNVRLAPLTAALLDFQMRHASSPAIARVAGRLGVSADWVVFGHVHRRGPLDGERWPALDGGVRLANPGSWLYEPLLVDRATPPHPYWPGGAVVVDSGREPRTIGLLDDLAAWELRSGPSRPGGARRGRARARRDQRDQRDQRDGGPRRIR